MHPVGAKLAPGRECLSISGGPQNLLLASLPVRLREQLTRDGQLISHERGDRLHNIGDEITEFLFPVTGMVSLTVDTSEGQTVEVAITGREGFVGASRYLGARTAATNAVVQVAGDMLHVQAEPVLTLAATETRLRTLVDRYLHSLMVEMSQSAVCNQVHSVEQRTSRWLLHASDRAATKDLRLTHEFLSQMLAVRRASVTTVVGIFTRADLTTTQRGLISVVDREGLRTLACECYEIVLKATPRYD